MTPGDRVICQSVEATYRGLNPRVPGDYWVEFDCGGGWWSFSPSDVQEIRTPPTPTHHHPV